MSVTFTELVEEVEQAVYGVYSRNDWQDVLRGIEDYFLELRGLGVSGKIFQKYTSDELSRFAGDLAVLRASLISVKERADKERKVAKRLVEVKRPGVMEQVRDMLTKKFEAEGRKAPTVGEVDAETEKRMAKVHLLMDLHEAQYEKIQSYWFSIPEVIKSIELRIHELKEDRGTAKHYGLAGEDAILSLDISAQQGDTQPSSSPPTVAGDSNTPVPAKE